MTLRINGVDPDAGGTSLPTASGAGEVPVSSGAGTAYTATSLATEISDGVGATLAGLLGATAGAAVIGDGAGDVATTSADVSAMLAAANSAAILAALGIASASHTSGLRAALPAGTAGDTYRATDEGVLYQRDAVGWRAVAVDIFEPLIASAEIALDFDDASGAATIVSDGAAGGTLAIAGSPVIEVVGALHGRALRCPTGSDYYQGLDAEAVGAAWTLEAWVKGGSGNGLQNVLVRRADIASWGAPYVAATLSLSTTALRVGVGLAPSTLTTSVTTNVDTLRWSHLVATWDGTTLSGYINGALATAVAAAGTIVANGSGRWGVGQIPQGAGAASEPFTGQIQGARVYSTCLTADEVLRRYARTVGMWRGTP